MLYSAAGTAGLVVALAFGGAGTLASLIFAFWGSAKLFRLSRTFLIAGVAATVVSVAALEVALVTHDFSIAYVVANNSRETPLLYDITGMWSALQGSLLLWAALQGAFIALVIVATRREEDRRTAALSTGILGVVFTYFIAMMVLAANPFMATRGPIPADGLGPNPLLQEYPLVAVHPPLLYAGFVGMSVPFALMVAALARKNLTPGWIGRVQRWALFSWVALTAGIVLGAWWSYQVLGWGGYWAWDPVENAALLPWLTTTAFLHSVLIDRHRRRMGPASFALVAASFSLTILGTYFTRSGVLQSVHAFSDSSLGTALIVLFALTVTASVAVALFRADLLLSGRRVAVSSRPAGLLLNNGFIVLMAAVILAGTVFPLFIQYLEHQSVTVGAPFFNRFVIPIGLAILALMAIGPWLRWRETPLALLAERLLLPAIAAAVVLAVAVLAGVRSLATIGAYALATFVIVSSTMALARLVLASSRTRRVAALLSRSSAGLVVHIGVAIVAVGMASATTFGHQGSVKLRPLGTISVYGQRLTYLGVRTVVTPARTSFEAAVVVNGGGTFYPAISQFGQYATPVGTPAVDVNPLRDVYLTIDNPPSTATGAITLGIVVQPLIVWLWVGAAVMAGGGLLALPGTGVRRRPAARTARTPEMAAGGGR